MRQGRAYVQSAAWWSVKKLAYPFHATTPTTVRPPIVERETGILSASCVLEHGTRTWGFNTAEQRDAFCAAYGGVKI